MPKFLFDECIGKPVVEGIIAGLSDTYNIQHLPDLFGAGSKDHQWVPEAAKESWLVITSDLGRQSKVKLPQILKSHELNHVTLSNPVHHFKKAKKIEAFIEHWHYIITLYEFKPKGTEFRMQRKTINDRVQIHFEQK